jgi:hypothetical protein
MVLDDSCMATITLELHQVYDRARFELAIDYSGALSPRLSSEDVAWVLGLVG